MQIAQKIQSPFRQVKQRLSAVQENIPSKLSALIVLGGALCGFTTYLIITGLSPIRPSQTVLSSLMFVNVVFVFLMLGLVTVQLFDIYRDRKLGVGGAKLHSRLVGLFSVVALIPAILVAVFAFVTLDQWFNQYFSDRTKAIINNSSLVANAYLDENREKLRNDSVVMARDLNRAAGYFKTDKSRFSSFLTAQAALRELNMAILIDRDGTVLDVADTRKKYSLPVPPAEAFEAADKLQPVIITASGRSQIWGLLKLDGLEQAYLYVMRNVDERVLAQLQRTNLAVQEYREFESRRTEAQITFALVYIGIALVTLLAAIWFGLWISRTLATPIGDLIKAAEQVKDGDLSARVTQHDGNDELQELGATFNLMTEQLTVQRKEILDARDDLDLRHQFTEMVLNGVSSGVIGIDPNGLINHANLLAQQIAGKSEGEMVGVPVADAFPYFKELINSDKIQRNNNYEVEVTDDDGVTRVLLARLTSGTGNHEGDRVLTFDDMTGLLSAKRTAAWADIARRIAHEIKNPLTPIQLSAERLRSKYESEVVSDPDVFKTCTETIIRQVSDIGRMVDEFASFARMPSAVFKDFDLKDAVSQVVFLQRVAQPEIEFVMDDQIDGTPVINADRRQLSQALTNILKNACEAMNGEGGSDEKRIQVSLSMTRDKIHVAVADTGPGLPEADRHNLVEPYITTREQGTGLGLAIVKKVIEDHGGVLKLGDAPWVKDGSSGAQVTLIFPFQDNQTVGPSKVEEEVI